MITTKNKALAEFLRSIQEECEKCVNQDTDFEYNFLEEFSRITISKLQESTNGN